MVDSAEEYLGGKRSTARLPPMDQWIVKALQKHTLAGRVAVYGSMSPWYEALAVGAGAAEVTTIEYNNLTYTHPKMVQVAPRDVDPAAGFDAALSISSFDHDGLGRYGDAVHPDGDLLAMKAAQCLLRPGGLLFLTLPVGPDVVVWNLHRRYGRVRLPLLLRGWEVVDVIGWSWARFDAAADYRRSYEPVFVLRAPDGAEADADANADAVETPTKTEL
jgi:SAM-dependent methyltransferase